MTTSDTIRNRPVLVLYGLMIVTLAGLLPFPPLLQNQNYHQFADQRNLFGIPNFWNVVSNLPFIAVGAAGLLRLRQALLPAYCTRAYVLALFGPGASGDRESTSSPRSIFSFVVRRKSARLSDTKLGRGTPTNQRRGLR
ncbi:hypothetical protein JQ629_31030 [Bradyrhizobium sp. AUGA SZCCT0222]|uniref:hypothetical protein n=1 Tax=Bradyrhizobium sp. AUGA SZCCT0222 TaxID=2807668 RepID=UPI001BAAD66F|nr:hypothetical protein [Bradyrhizobium sp. AUGA SZCCT0222]MBR1271925.1 hypothetical protein [Bradyrhizobium sp. AUGA SZCCT0222]